MVRTELFVPSIQGHFSVLLTFLFLFLREFTLRLLWFHDVRSSLERIGSQNHHSLKLRYSLVRRDVFGLFFFFTHYHHDVLPTLSVSPTRLVWVRVDPSLSLLDDGVLRHFLQSTSSDNVLSLSHPTKGL